MASLRLLLWMDSTPLDNYRLGNVWECSSRSLDRRYINVPQLGVIWYRWNWMNPASRSKTITWNCFSYIFARFMPRSDGKYNWTALYCWIATQLSVGFTNFLQILHGNALSFSPFMPRFYWKYKGIALYFWIETWLSAGFANFLQILHRKALSFAPFMPRSDGKYNGTALYCWISTWLSPVFTNFLQILHRNALRLVPLQWKVQLNCIVFLDCKMVVTWIYFKLLTGMPWVLPVLCPAPMESTIELHWIFGFQHGCQLDLPIFSKSFTGMPLMHFLTSLFFTRSEFIHLFPPMPSIVLINSSKPFCIIYAAISLGHTSRPLLRLLT